jgi:hypothetical protein
MRHVEPPTLLLSFLPPSLPSGREGREEGKKREWGKGEGVGRVEVRRPPPRLLDKETRRKADALGGSSQRPQARSGRADGRAPPQEAFADIFHRTKEREREGEAQGGRDSMERKTLREEGL